MLKRQASFLQRQLKKSYCRLCKFVYYVIHRTLGDRVGEAKASGNLGNTLKVLGKFDEAIACCHRHLDLSRELKDRVRNSSSQT